MKITLVILVFFIGACGFTGQKSEEESDKEGNITSSVVLEVDPGKNMNVMIIDDGFNLDAQVFKNKIINQYTLQCNNSQADEQSSFKLGQENEPEQTEDEKFLKLKDAYIESLNSNSTCRIENSLEQVENKELSQYIEQKDRWNSEIDGKTIFKNILNEPELIKVSRSINLVSHHGTSTAGLIAYKNPNVKLVLLQLELGDPGEYSHSCLFQDKVDRTVRVLKDPEYRDLYLKKPTDPINKSLAEIMEKNNVKIINFSAGTLPRETIEARNIEKGCGKVSLYEYYKELATLDREKAELNRNIATTGFPEPLLIQAGGNESMEINDATDSDDCPYIRDSTLLIGSYDKSGTRSDFSNFGDCIDLYTVGRELVSASPYGFLNVQSGTSFSAPLITRYISMNFSDGTANSEIKQQLLNLRDENKYLPAAFPPELAIDNFDQKIGGFNLTPSTGRRDRNPVSPIFLKIRNIVSTLR